MTSCCLQRWYSMVSLTISQCSSAWLYWAVLCLKKRYALFCVNIAATLCSKLTFFVTYMSLVFKTEWWDAQTDGGVSGSLETNAGMKLFKLDAVILCCYFKHNFLIYFPCSIQSFDDSIQILLILSQFQMFWQYAIFNMIFLNILINPIINMNIFNITL